MISSRSSLLHLGLKLGQTARARIPAALKVLFHVKHR
jgi:hypothetical protein